MGIIKTCSEYLNESVWGDLLDKGTGEKERKEDLIRSNKEFKEIIRDLYKEQGSGKTLDVSSIGKRIVCDDLSYLFYGYSYVTKIIGLETWDVSKVTDMSCMFCYCFNLTELNIGSWDVSNVTNMYSMFCDCENLIELKIDNWDVSNVTNMFSMFYYCSRLNKKPKWYK